MAYQLPLPGMPEPDFSTCGYSTAQLANAERTVAMADALLEKHPELFDTAEAVVTEAASRGGYTGVRLLGEKLRAHLADSGSADSFSNDLIPAMTRRLMERSPWLAAYLEPKPAAVDAVMYGSRSE